MSHVSRLLVLLVCLGALLVRVPLGSLEFEPEQGCSSGGCCCSDPEIALSCCSGAAEGPIWVDACGCGGHEQDFGVYLSFDWSGEPARVAVEDATGAEPLAELREAPVAGRSPIPDPPVPRLVRPVG